LRLGSSFESLVSKWCDIRKSFRMEMWGPAETQTLAEGQKLQEISAICFGSKGFNKAPAL
jgi:hypothetical protein